MIYSHCFSSNMSNPLWLPEIVGSVMENIQLVPDLLSCACVNSIWNVEALRKLYMGSLNNMQFRTPDIVSLNRLFVASQERFARNMGFVKNIFSCLQIHPHLEMKNSRKLGSYALRSVGRCAIASMLNSFCSHEEEVLQVS